MNAVVNQDVQDETTQVVAAVAPPTPEELMERENKRIAALDDIGASLERWKEEAVVWRGTFEFQWQADYDQYASANNMLPEAKRQRGGDVSAGDEYRATHDNITRPKVIITAARLGDMLFPTNDSNWDLEASPRPEIPEEMIPPPPETPPTEEGQPPTPGRYTPEQLLVVKRQVASKAAYNMKVTIDDQLEESSYADEGRAAIFDACLYGSGVIAGPTPRFIRKHGYGAQSAVREMPNPTAEYVDLWSFYPQPSRSIDECEHVFRLYLMPRRSLRQLAKQPGFDRSQISRLLEFNKPTHGALATIVVERGQLRPDDRVMLDDKFEVWRYRGPMPKTAFAAFCSGLVAQGLLGEDEAAEVLVELETNPLNEVDCEVWMSQGIVIKMALSTLEDGELGYYVFNYETNPNSIFGFGVPYLCRDDQIAADQVWHSIMLNTMMSAGAQIGVLSGKLTPTSNEHGAAGRAMTFSANRPRVWALNDDIKDIREALSVFTIPNVTEKMMGVYERVKANADEHTMTPMIAQGEPTSAVPTSSGMAMLMNAANVVMRRLAKNWDSSITTPLIQGFYDWNMKWNQDPTIKGDFCVIPKGASHLLIKDVQAQHIQFATNLFSSNPLLQPYMKPGPFARKNIEMLDVSPDELLYTDEEVIANAQRAGEQPDPEVLKAQAQATHAEAATARAQAEVESTKEKAAFDRWERELAHQERMADVAARERIQAMQLQATEANLALKMAEMERGERLEMERILADQRKHSAAMGEKRYAADMAARMKAEQIASGERQTEIEIAIESPNPRLS